MEARLDAINRITRPVAEAVDVGDAWRADLEVQLRRGDEHRAFEAHLERTLEEGIGVLRARQRAALEQSYRRLAVEECANHAREQNSIKDYCCREWTEGYRCVFMLADGGRCRYFEESVLGLKPDLEALYWADRQARAEGHELTSLQAEIVVQEVAASMAITCARCGQSFPARSNRQKYCDRCRKAVRNKQSQARMKRRRQKAS